MVYHSIRWNVGIPWGERFGRGTIRVRVLPGQFILDNPVGWHTFRTLFPRVLRVCARSALKHAWTGQREPLQSVSLGFFLTF